jgi:hypothetical protein
MASGSTLCHLADADQLGFDLCLDFEKAAWNAPEHCINLHVFDSTKSSLEQHLRRFWIFQQALVYL